ncbi:hypothetical protein PT974_07325 [Cladobotryum mycophilum]|uniref:Uncharacterized protein n=1 Tax=Cladobotryum mycophilum TaxID=491253 RepID=A0ABR0SP74_9HYPO
MDTIAARFVEQLLQGNHGLQKQLQGAMPAVVSTERVAKVVLKKVEDSLKQPHDKLGPTVSKAYRDASKAAEKHFPELVDYVKSHPYEIAAGVLLTLTALGVLARLAPMVLRLLGFGKLGPRVGSYAANWQSTYAGYVPKGALFAYLQRMGMTW